jgi:hypothetical protein
LRLPADTAALAASGRRKAGSLITANRLLLTAIAALALAGAGISNAFAERIRREADIATAAVGMITAPAQADQIIRNDGAWSSISLAAPLNIFNVLPIFYSPQPGDRGILKLRTHSGPGQNDFWLKIGMCWASAPGAPR